MVRLNVALVDRSQAEKLTHFLVAACVNAVEAVAQQLVYDAVNGLRQLLERTYSTVRMPWLVATAFVPWWLPPAFVGLVKGVQMTKNRNRLNVDSGTPIRVPRRLLGLIDLVRDVVPVASS